MKGRYFVIKFTPEGRLCGPPFCFQAFSILGILLWILKVCKCVHVKDSKSTRCYRPASKKMPVFCLSWQISGKLASLPRCEDDVEWLRGTAKMNTWFDQLHLIIFGGKKGYNWLMSPCTNSDNFWVEWTPNKWYTVCSSCISPLKYYWSVSSLKYFFFSLWELREREGRSPGRSNVPTSTQRC